MLGIESHDKVFLVGQLLEDISDYLLRLQLACTETHLLFAGLLERLVAEAESRGLDLGVIANGGAELKEKERELSGTLNFEQLLRSGKEVSGVSHQVERTVYHENILYLFQLHEVEGAHS